MRRRSSPAWAPSGSAGSRPPIRPIRLDRTTGRRQVAHRDARIDGAVRSRGTDGVEPADIEWEPGDLRGGAIFDLAHATGTAVRSARFEDRGEYAIRARHDETSVAWDVTVTEDGREPPTIEALTTSTGPDESVGVDDSIEVVADVSDAPGDLDRLLWDDGRNYLVVEIHDVEGESDTARLSLAETPHWIDYGYPTVAYPVCSDGRLGAGVSSDGPMVRQPFALDVVATNDPVSAGDRFAATVAVEHVGDVMMVGPNTQSVRLVGGEVVDGRSVTLEWNESTTIELGYETYPVRRDVTFSIRVECADGAVTREIDVFADG